ncbi:MAG: hypothetical protein QOF98_1016, partial [Streptomyces sp.]|nr:hypothetical protein [Streptomyces sp.]
MPEPRPSGEPADAAAGPAEPGEGGETRAAERSAERAADVAAAEGFHPLRIRPYVAEPAGGPQPTNARRLLPADPDGPATTDLGLFPAAYSGLEYDRRLPAQAAGYESDAAYVEPLVVRGRHRRRRRGIFVAAATVAASALAAGAVAVTGQLMADESGTGQALPDRGTSMPDVQLPDDMSPAAATTAPPISRPAPATAAPAPSSSRTVSAPPSSPATGVSAGTGADTGTGAATDSGTGTGTSATTGGTTAGATSAVTTPSIPDTIPV